jgi:hypothetical protein
MLSVIVEIIKCDRKKGDMYMASYLIKNVRRVVNNWDISGRSAGECDGHQGSACFVRCVYIRGWRKDVGRRRRHVNSLLGNRGLFLRLGLSWKSIRNHMVNYAEKCDLLVSARRRAARDYIL